MTTANPIRTAWVEALAAAFRLAKADRARQLRGDFSVRTFDARGLHPYSVEWGRVLALEALLPGLSDERLAGDPPTDWLSMRRTAGVVAEQEFAAAIRAGEADVWAGPR